MRSSNSQVTEPERCDAVITARCAFAVAHDATATPLFESVLIDPTSAKD
jgi:hypothetical protein